MHWRLIGSNDPYGGYASTITPGTRHVLPSWTSKVPSSRSKRASSVPVVSPVPSAPVPSLDMSVLAQQIQSMSPTTTTTIQQQPSEQLEAAAQQFVNTLNQLSAGFQSAYQAKQDTYGDLLTSLSNLFRAQGGGAAQATQASALASGLTPLEASGLGQQALMGALQQYYPMKAQTETEAADVAIQLQDALQGLQQNMYQPFLSSVMSPYWQGLAGQTQTTTDPMRQMGLLAQMSQAMSSDQLGWAQLAQQGSQFQQSLAMQQAQMEQQGQQFAQGMGLDWARLDQQGRNFLTGLQAELQRSLLSSFSNMALQTSQQQWQSLENQKEWDRLIQRIEAELGGAAPDWLNDDWWDELLLPGLTGAGVSPLPGVGLPP